MIHIDERQLIRLAGVRAFGQGLRLFEEGQVSGLEASDRLTSATVGDGGTHKVGLRHTHRVLEGECDCEASDGIDFCQHCVAVAIALQDRLLTRKPMPKRQVINTIRRQLSGLSRKALLEVFIELIEQDRSLRDDVLQEAMLLSGTVTYTDLKHMITAIELDGEAWDRRAITSFFRRFESLLSRISKYADRLDPIVLLRATEYAVRHMNDEICLIDDYVDYWDWSTELLATLHLDALSRLGWQPAELAAYWADRYLGEQWHPVRWSADIYVTDLADSFPEALLSEIDARLAAVIPSDAEATESLRQELEELKVNVLAVVNSR